MQSSSTEDSVTTLGSLRASRNLSGREVRDRMVQFDPKSPKNISTVSKIEANGTGSLDTLKAYAFAVSAPLDVVLSANENTKTCETPFQFPRGRKKKTAPIMN